MGGPCYAEVGGPAYAGVGAPCHPDQLNQVGILRPEKKSRGLFGLGPLFGGRQNGAQAPNNYDIGGPCYADVGGPCFKGHGETANTCAGFC